MGNPAISTQPADVERPLAADPERGVLSWLGADAWSAATACLPPPSDMRGKRRVVDLTRVPRFGAVRMVLESRSYRHRRNEFWHWSAVRADPICVALPVVHYPVWRS